MLQSVLGIGKEMNMPTSTFGKQFEVRYEKAADFVNPTLTRVLLIMMHGMIAATVSLCSRKWLLFFYVMKYLNQKKA